jgi:hypothetical protein
MVALGDARRAQELGATVFPAMPFLFAKIVETARQIRAISLRQLILHTAWRILYCGHGWLRATGWTLIYAG